MLTFFTAGRKKIALLLIIVLLVSAFTGCAGPSGSKGADGYDVQLETPPQATDKLVLYQPPGMASLFDFAIPIYKAKFPDVEVEVKEFGDRFADWQSVEDYRTLVQTQIMAGQGPDVLLWDNTPFGINSGNLFGDVYKAMDTDLFYNLDCFIANDPEFNLADFNQAVVEAGKYKGKQQFIPISYDVSILATTRQALQANDIDLPESPTFDDFANIAKEYCSKNKEDMDKWFLDYRDAYNENPLCSLIYPFNGIEILDYETKEVLVDTNEFRKTMEMYQSIHEMTWTRLEEGINYTPEDIPYIQAIHDGQVLFGFANTVSLLSVIYDYYGGALSYGGDPVLLGIPNVYGGKNVAYPDTCVGIRQTSENKANAYEFIKVLLSQTVQTDNSVIITDISIPIRNEARKEKIATVTSIAERVGITRELASTVLNQEQMDQVYDLLSDVTCVKNYSQDVIDLLWQDMLPYFDGRESYDACVKKLKNDLQIYIAE